MARYEANFTELADFTTHQVENEARKPSSSREASSLASVLGGDHILRS